MTIPIWIAAAIVGLVIGVAISLVIQNLRMKKANADADSIIQEAVREADTLTKERMLETKEEIQQMRQEAEEESKKKMQSLQEEEKKLNQREMSIERKADLVEKREEELKRMDKSLDERIQRVNKKDEQLSQIIEEQNQRLKAIANMSSEEAVEELKENLLEKAREEASHEMKRIQDEAVRNARKEASKVVVSAIQRSAADHTAETTVSVINLPNDNMKGRIIGREGRNIRHFESLTGVELIVDDTPEAVVLSSFDPIRREKARIALEALIADGRIHPSRIEEMYEKATEQVDDSIMEAAEEAVSELGLSPIPSEMMRLVGKLKYRTSYGQNILKHCIEVGWLTGLMAAELGFDGEIAKRAGFLHDIGKAVDRDTSGTHALIGADIAKKFDEPEIVVNAIASHHEEVEMTHSISALVQAADTASGSRRGARGDTLESYIKRLEKLEEIAENFSGVSNSYAIQAGREVRVMVEPEEINDGAADILAKDISGKIQDEMNYPGQVKVVIIREYRAVNYAR
ncbi:MAG: ribonuclease Y [Candidatus Marinimicrobia bacterium]|nr:ribonuclease Y [Candidatus Neomarinimicrobiota bacterium]MCF7828276.1 ribonuclease Y [Candidatus Neomarinimicrobiota bacterium]MCF7879549.1 ribonuclease Y [Candidatus Neomarinimicrobiota bacterium]